MKSRFVEFVSPYNVRVGQDDLKWPQPNKLLIKTTVSAISSGTELLVYRGRWPKNCSVDETISSLSDNFRYPLKYGYSTVGEVLDVGPGLDQSWIGKRVFSFNPHESLFTASPHDTISIPDNVDTLDACMLPNMETAVNLVMDGHPLIGERVCVFGLGVVGLLTTAVLNATGLESLTTFDTFDVRRDASVRLGAHRSIDPAQIAECSSDNVPNAVGDLLGSADLTYELSGNPEALNSAIEVTGFAGRIIVGSWYGSKTAEINLGGSFHRSRLKICSSQVSTIAPEFSARWTKTRRMDLAFSFLRKVRPSSLITNRFHISQAASAYELVDRKPGEAIQVIFTYED